MHGKKKKKNSFRKIVDNKTRMDIIMYLFFNWLRKRIVSPPSYGGATAARNTRGRGKRKKGLHHGHYSPNREETENKKKCYRDLEL